MPRKPKGAAVIERMNRQLERLEVEYGPPASMRPNHYNPNRQNEHEFRLLCKSMEDGGFTQPIMLAEVLDDEDWRAEVDAGHYQVGELVIVDGEHRWRAAQQLGLPEIPYVKVPYTVAQARISTLQMNRARGSEDIELATAILRDLETLGHLEWAADSLDIGDDELQRLLDDIAAPESMAGEEFSEAWAPAGQSINRDGNISDTANASHTPAALTMAREQEERLKAAKSEEERQALREDKRLFRLVLSFTGDEADVVRSALGEAPAVRVLEWCQAAGPLA